MGVDSGICQFTLTLLIFILDVHIDILTMVARACCYYGEAFKGARGVTQGDPLPPTIFNVVVDVFVRHWIEGLVTETEEKVETGREGRHQSAVFYAGDGMIVSSEPNSLQDAFSSLVAIFDRVSLQTNVNKTVIMACHPCWAVSGNRTTAGYNRRLTGVGKTFKERQRERVAYGECGTEIAAGSMSSHMMTRHGKAATRQHFWSPQTAGEPRLYKMRFPARDGRRQCPVEGCPGVSATQAAMRVHFVHRHVHDTVVILE